MHRQIGILLKKLASGVAWSIQKSLCVTVSFCRSTRFDYRSIQKGVCVTVSVDYRELTTQSIILSFYTLRLPCKSCDEIVLERYAEAGMSMGRSSKAAHSDMKPQNTVSLSQA